VALGQHGKFPPPSFGLLLVFFPFQKKAHLRGVKHCQFLMGHHRTYYQETLCITFCDLSHYIILLNGYAKKQHLNPLERCLIAKQGTLTVSVKPNPHYLMS